MDMCLCMWRLAIKYPLLCSTLYFQMLLNTLCMCVCAGTDAYVPVCAQDHLEVRGRMINILELELQVTL